MVRVCSSHCAGPSNGLVARQAGFTLVEVFAASVVLSAVVLCLVRAWTVFDVTSLDLQLRQKAIFVLNGEIERLSGLYTIGGFSGAGPSQLQTVSGGNYNAIPGIPNSATRLVYGSGTSSANSFTSTSYSTFTNVNTADTTVLIDGGGATTRNFVWLDRPRNILGRLSWIACPTSDPILSGSSTASVCRYGGTATAGTSCLAYSGVAVTSSTNSAGAACYLLTVVLDYPYRAIGTAPLDEAQISGAHLTTTTLTLATIVGRWF